MTANPSLVPAVEAPVVGDWIVGAPPTGVALDKRLEQHAPDHPLQASQ